MNAHSRAKTCPESRGLLVRRVLEEAWSMDQASRAFGISRQTAHKWVKRFLGEGEAGLRDRSSRPRRSPRKLPADREQWLLELRRKYRLTAEVLAAQTGVPRSTVGRVLRRHHLSRSRELEPKLEIRRYERKAPGELLHLDIKKLGRIGGIGHRITGRHQDRHRGVGWEFAHVAIDDFSRLSYVEILPDERGVTVAGFLGRALAWFRQHGVEVHRVLTDNGPGYLSMAFAQLCRENRLRHLRTRPYTPRTNGKAERFIQTALRSWAYGQAYNNSQQRLEALPRWLHYYNHHRPHAALGRLPPASRVSNLVSTHS